MLFSTICLNFGIVEEMFYKNFSSLKLDIPLKYIGKANGLLGFQIFLLGLDLLQKCIHFPCNFSLQFSAISNYNKVLHQAYGGIQKTEIKLFRLKLLYNDKLNKHLF